MAFLSVITRHLISRPNYLIINQASLSMQYDPDYEQIVEVDEIGKGWQYAHELSKRAAAKAQGNYVLTLDDDDMLINPEAIHLWKAATINNPPGVIHRSWIGELGPLPDAAHWQKRPDMGQIGSDNFILRRDILLLYLHQLDEGCYTSDYDLITAVYRDHGDKIIWLDKILCWSLRRSMGRGEAVNP